METYTLKNGIKVPVIGFGTFQATDEEACQAIKDAVDVGYRLIDTAAVYKNEKGVGQGIKECGVNREELFITSKVWNTNRGYENTLAAFDETMKKLDLEYLDLYLIHWPANKKQFGNQADEINASTWKALEKLYKEGKVKAIGVCNFETHHLEKLLETAEIVPMIDQLEYHPGWIQSDTVLYCQKNGIVVEAWSPLGRSTLLKDETLAGIASHYNKSVAQLCLRYAIQNGVLPLPKSVHKERMVSNLDVFDFEITKEDMEALNRFENTGLVPKLPDEVDF